MVLMIIKIGFLFLLITGKDIWLWSERIWRAAEGHANPNGNASPLTVLPFPCRIKEHGDPEIFCHPTSEVSPVN